MKDLSAAQRRKVQRYMTKNTCTVEVARKKLGFNK